MRCTGRHLPGCLCKVGVLCRQVSPVSYGVGPCGGRLVGYNGVMSITEIKTIISQLPPADLADLTEWFEEFQEDAWDRQIANDVKAGRFEAIFQRVEEQAESGQCRAL